MLLPIGDDNVKGGPKPYFSYAFIIINILVFVFLQLPDDYFTFAYSVIPFEIVNGTDLVDTQHLSDGTAIPQRPGPNPIYLTLFCSMFMHAGWMHLIGNMVFLWVFADNIESTVGHKRFVLFYVFGGVFASLAHIASDAGSMIPSLGASGAIAACLGAYLVMFPKSKIKLLFIAWIFSVPAFLFLGIWIFQNLVSGMGSLDNDLVSGTAWWAHIGGFFYGILWGIYFRLKYPKIKRKGKEYKPVEIKSERFNNREITKRLKNIGDKGWLK